MAREDPFKVEAVVLEVLSNKTFRAELANGHQLLAFVPGNAPVTFGPPVVGERVRLQLSPYDLSVGRMIGEEKTILIT